MRRADIVNAGFDKRVDAERGDDRERDDAAESHVMQLLPVHARLNAKQRKSLRGRCSLTMVGGDSGKLCFIMGPRRR